MPFDAFISYSSKDKTTADTACARLESAGVRCWMAPRDIRAGTEYAEGIIEGIDSCRIMVLIFSSSANASRQIHRGIERAVSKALTIIPFRIEDIAPTKAMEYYLGSIHWLDALTPPLVKHLGQLVEQVKANLQVDAAETAAPVGVFERTAPKESSFGGYRNKADRPRLLATTANAAKLAAIVGILGIVVVLLWQVLPRPPTVAITKSDAFGGSGGTAFDDTDINANHLPISALSIVMDRNPADTTQRIIGGVQAEWGGSAGPLHGGKGPFAEPANAVKFAENEKIGRVVVNSRLYHYPAASSPPQWIAGLEIWTDTRVYTFGDMTSGSTNQCMLAYGEILLGFFGRSGRPDRLYHRQDKSNCRLGGASATQTSLLKY
jgi:hypothetical protein